MRTRTAQRVVAARGVERPEGARRVRSRGLRQSCTPCSSAKRLSRSPSPPRPLRARNYSTVRSSPTATSICGMRSRSLAVDQGAQRRMRSDTCEAGPRSCHVGDGSSTCARGKPTSDPPFLSPSGPTCARGPVSRQAVRGELASGRTRRRATARPETRACRPGCARRRADRAAAQVPKKRSAGAGSGPPSRCAGLPRLPGGVSWVDGILDSSPVTAPSTKTVLPSTARRRALPGQGFDAGVGMPRRG